jgi:hypothetical protein
MAEPICSARRGQYCRVPCGNVVEYRCATHAVARPAHIKSSRMASLLPLGKLMCCLILLLAFSAGLFSASAFDLNGFKARAETTLADLNAKRLEDSNPTLARLNEMLAIGVVGMREYGVNHPKYAKLMEAAIADVQAMKQMTDVQIEEKWGEMGNGGDAAGVPLKSLGENSEQRAYLELVVGPATQYIFIKKWQSTKRVKWLEKARDEAVELLKHLETIQVE